jgi:hypothetical protein
VMRMTFPAFALATHTLARCRSSRIPILSTMPSVAHHVLHYRFTLEITCSSETSQCASLRFPGMDNCDVSELAEELAQVTCWHLPWSDQRVIALELGVGECDLAARRTTRFQKGPRPDSGYRILRTSLGRACGIETD